MRFRYTKEELKEKSDYEMLRCVIVERQSGLERNCPLYKRLRELEEKLHKGRSLTKEITY